MDGALAQISSLIQINESVNLPQIKQNIDMVRRPHPTMCSIIHKQLFEYKKPINMPTLHFKYNRKQI
jgi:hypothetical protein